jgi:[protein-PII] uridylyltransferase
MYTTNYTDSQLFDLTAFEASLQSTTHHLSIFRSALEKGHAILKKRFQTNMNATEYVHQRAWLVDQLLQYAFNKLFVMPYRAHVSLVAVGGYGRGELHPNSDVDIMLLLDIPLDTAIQTIIEQFITFLWDIRLEIGHSVRTVAECQREALNDITVATNLIEARLLIGSADLFQQLQICSEAWTTKDFFASKVAEQHRRHHKFHDTAYNLEPNLKEGPGGLRDIHMIGWVAKRHFGALHEVGAITLHDLVSHGFLTEEEYLCLTEAQEFLWRIRCFLHLLTGRREDRILFDYQRSLANTFGYQDTQTQLGVELFMKQYYRTVMELRSLNDMLLQLFNEAIIYADAPAVKKSLNKRFRVHNDYIEVRHDKVFMNYPFALLEIFLLMEQHPEINGVRASTIRLIRQYRHLIDDAFHRDLRSRSLFFEIMRQPQGITHALRYMSRYAVLAAYIPAFGRIVGQMQYDLFHVYTVDQHSIFVVRNLRRFMIPKHHDEFPLCSKIMGSLPKPELLYLAGLFHDIGKGRGGDHSKIGEAEALNFCQAHGLSDFDGRLVAWLVRNHLVMSTTAQRQDISDPEVIKKFAQQVADTTRLDYLYLLTVADIRATNPNLWNGWKDSLLASLYRKTQQMLSHGSSGIDSRQEQVREIQAAARQLLADPQNPHVDVLWHDLSDDYFLRAMPATIAKETEAILNHADLEEPLVWERQQTPGITEILQYLRDRPYIFGETTYFLEQQGLTIVDAFIAPTEGQHTISEYMVLAADGSELKDPEHIQTILDGLKQTLNHQSTAAFAPVTRRIPRQIKHFPVPTRIIFTQDYINDHTVMEVVTTDRPGLLSRIGQTFITCEIRLKTAKIATFGARVEDIFYITDLNNHALFSADQLDCIHEQLSNLLDTDEPIQPLMMRV